jgi:hypothetical protein
MAQSENASAADSFKQREGRALIAMGVIAAVQILFTAVVLLFVDGRSSGPLLRPSLPKTIIN